MRAPSKQCPSDPIPTWLLKDCIDVLSPPILNIINKSIDSSQVPSVFKESIVTPLLKKPTLDPEALKNYRPVNNLPFVSKILEKIIAVRMNNYKDANSLRCVKPISIQEVPLN